MRSTVYARIESAKFGAKGVWQTTFLFITAYLVLILIGNFGPSVFMSAEAETRKKNVLQTMLSRLSISSCTKWALQVKTCVGKFECCLVGRIYWVGGRQVWAGCRRI